MDDVMTWKVTDSICRRCGFEITEIEEFGSCTFPGQFWEYHHAGDKRSAVCYIAQRIPNSCEIIYEA